MSYGLNMVTEDSGLQIQPRLLLGLLLGAAALYILPASVGQVIYLLLALHALRGPRQTIEAIALMALALLGNPAVFPGGAKTFRWVILFAGFGRVLWDSVIGARPAGAGTSVLKALFLFAGATLVFALLKGWLPMLSLFKLTSFVIGVTVMFVSFYRTLYLGAYWRSWFTTYFTAVIVLSVLAYPIGIGYLRTSQGFQGILNHPQALGPILGAFLPWIIGYCIIRPDQIRRRLPLALGGCGLIFLSASRTGALLVLAGFILSLAVFTLWRKDRIEWGYFMQQPIVWASVAVLSLVMMLYSAAIQDAMIGFIQKDAEEEAGLVELAEDTRGHLIRQSMENFRQAPLVGIGFGIPSDSSSLEYNSEGYTRTQYVMGIPISASYEKGFMPAAVLEEVGLIGAALLLLLLGAIAVPVMKFGSLPVVWTFWASLLINLGEAVLFSIGGIGLMMWLMLAFCHAQAIERRDRLQSFALGNRIWHRHGQSTFAG